ncbi:hypothetical protein SBOR_8799 [Sclerotinia borealis F-4128]|uniref:Uncharacterized protein n=1 Tax=Sclerotinia borealis (strain F-4128) TaxID=1432307 RepID=W9C557_SCLBF|nr:hypothetical protein SBOR_8799 [Sclerotinia borealis F-4128]
MAGFLSTLRRSCKTLFASFNTTLSTLKRWFHREITPTLQDIASTIHDLYHNYMRPFVLRSLRFVCDHPFAIAIGILSIIAIIYPGVIITLLLFILGFGVLGPAAGSIAALIQALIGNVSAGSLFAMFQSAGMAGFGLMTLHGVAICIPVLILLAVLVYLVVVWRLEMERVREKEKTV